MRCCVGSEKVYGICQLDRLDLGAHGDIAQIIANGFGVTLASLSSIEHRIEGFSILQLKDAKPDLELGLIYTSVNRDLPLIQGFLGMLARPN